MAEPRKPMATPRQLLLIGVLGAVLAGVLIVQFGGTSSASPSSGAAAKKAVVGASKPVEGPKSASPPAPPVLAESTEKPQARSWPKWSGEMAAQYDPFALPKALAAKPAQDPEAKQQKSQDSARKAAQEALATLRSRGASAVLRDERGAAAVIGNRVVRVGDTVEGYRVEAIDANGVVLAPSRAPDPKKERP